MLFLWDIICVLWLLEPIVLLPLLHIDMSAGLQITGWPAHDSPVSSVLFGPAETSIFSLGSDGKIFEWSLHNQGQIIWSRDCSRFCNPESFNKRMHEVALDSNGKRLLATSGLVRAPIYQVQGHERGLRTLPHTAPITSVDWHPTRPIYVTGSEDHSVRVTSILWYSMLSSLPLRFCWLSSSMECCSVEWPPRDEPVPWILMIFLIISSR